MGVRKVSRNDCFNIVDMFQHGVLQRDIANKYDVDQSTVSRILREFGATTGSKYTSVPSSEYENIVCLYKNGYIQKEIANMYNTSTYAIWQILKRNGIVGRRAKLDFSLQEVQNMYEMYCRKISVQDISERYQISEKSVYDLFRRYDMQIRDLSHAKQKYSIDEHYFDQIDTPNKAYILGILWADGCNSVNDHHVTLSLQERDRHILEDIQHELNMNNKLMFLNRNKDNPNRSDQYRLNISNKHISQRLCALGMVNNKTLILSFPEWMNEDLYPHFIRGFMDGDGSIWFSNDDKKCRVGFVGTEMMICSIRDIVYRLLNINMTIKDAPHANEVIRYGTIDGNRQVLRFLNWIYENADLKLKRKYEKYQQLLMMYSNNINNSCLN